MHFLSGSEKVIGFYPRNGEEHFKIIILAVAKGQI